MVPPGIGRHARERARHAISRMIDAAAAARPRPRSRSRLRCRRRGAEGGPARHRSSGDPPGPSASRTAIAELRRRGLVRALRRERRAERDQRRDLVLAALRRPRHLERSSRPRHRVVETAGLQLGVGADRREPPSDQPALPSLARQRVVPGGAATRVPRRRSPPAAGPHRSRRRERSSTACRSPTGRAGRRRSSSARAPRPARRCHAASSSSSSSRRCRRVPSCARWRSRAVRRSSAPPRSGPSPQDQSLHPGAAQNVLGAARVRRSPRSPRAATAPARAGSRPVQ